MQLRPYPTIGRQKARGQAGEFLTHLPTIHPALLTAVPIFFTFIYLFLSLVCLLRRRVITVD